MPKADPRESKPLGMLLMFQARRRSDKRAAKDRQKHPVCNGINITAEMLAIRKLQVDSCLPVFYNV